jgi:N-succinyldiaminopimelate aminotransferase
VNPELSSLHPYPFEKLRALFSGVAPPAPTPIRLSIGEPQHATPEFIRRSLVDHLDGLSTYPTTAGSEPLRAAIAAWFTRRYDLRALDPVSQVLPVNGTREALFAFAQAVVDGSKPDPLVVSPNPFYQIYEGAAILSGAAVAYLNQTPDTDFVLDLTSLSVDEWRRTQLLYVCSPGNPTGRVVTLDEWRALFELADRCGFVIASDECYSDIYDEDRSAPLGALQAAERLGRSNFRGLVVFASLSKRSNAPGLRSGAVAGDARLLQQFLLYRTYHGCAMSLAVQHASIAAWHDEAHVRENRAKYKEKFAAVVPLLSTVMEVRTPDAGFYLWPRVPPSTWSLDGRSDDNGSGQASRSGAAAAGDDAAFARALFAATHVTVLPGQFLGREAHGGNPGRGFVRIALVPELDDCVEAARRIVEFCRRG